MAGGGLVQHRAPGQSRAVRIFNGTLTAIGELLITAGLVVALFLCWQLWWTSIDANARNKIAFTLDTADAASLAKDGALAPEDFAGLGPYEIYASLLSRGQQTGWFSGRTLPPPKQCASPAAIIAESQARYGRVTNELPAPPSEPVNQRSDVDDEPFGLTDLEAS